MVRNGLPCIASASRRRVVLTMKTFTAAAHPIVSESLCEPMATRRRTGGRP